MSIAKNFHDVPRFGHDDEFSLLFSDDKRELNDYIQGILFIPCFLLGFFFLWALILVVFTCLGPKKVGFLSGFHIKEPKPSLSIPRKKFRLPALVRGIFLFSGIIVIVFTILLVALGLNELINVTKDGQDIVTVREDLKKYPQKI